MTENEKFDTSSIDVAFGDVWKLRADERNYVLLHKRGKGYRIEGYYNTLEQVFSTVFERTIRDSDAKTINQLLKVVKQTRADIKQYALAIQNEPH